MPMHEFVNRVIEGDCTKVLPRLPKESVDFVLTDPPYLVNFRDRSGRSVQGDRRGTWLRGAFAEAYRVLRPNRFCVSFYGWQAVDRFYRAWTDAGFRPVGHLVWVKDYTSGERYVANCHESAYLLAKGDPPRPRLRLRDKLSFPYNGNRLHPTEKAPLMLAPLVRAFTKPGQIVLDPFAGSASTLAAAKDLGRRFIGIEISKEYAEAGRRRLRRL